MITLQEAIAIAKAWSDKFDTYQEYEDAYEFYVNDGELYYGGGDRCCIIEKKTGRKMPWALYFMDADRNIVKVGEPVKLENVIFNGDTDG